MFENFDRSDQELLYQGLKSLIEYGDGRGFLNRDRGHLAYQFGARGTVDTAKWGDGPDQNRLYKMLAELSYRLSDIDDGIRREDFTNWQNFCQFAIKCYKQRHA